MDAGNAARRRKNMHQRFRLILIVSLLAAACAAPKKLGPVPANPLDAMLDCSRYADRPDAAEQLQRAVLRAYAVEKDQKRVRTATVLLLLASTGPEAQWVAAPIHRAHVELQQKNPEAALDACRKIVMLECTDQDYAAILQRFAETDPFTLMIAQTTLPFTIPAIKAFEASPEGSFFMDVRVRHEQLYDAKVPFPIRTRFLAFTPLAIDEKLSIDQLDALARDEAQSRLALHRLRAFYLRPENAATRQGVAKTLESIEAELSGTA